MTRRTLQAWLSWLEAGHPRAIDLGLERVRAVAERMAVLQPRCPTVVVGGTNGKGSCVATLEIVLEQAGHRVGAYTSPHLLRFNERVRVACDEASDARIIEAFERVERYRRNISLTYFEFATLAAFDIFSTENCDVWLLEVGMGGSLDAVNVLDADVAVVTSIGLDHQQWLGDDLETIAREKAGIFRPGKPAVVGAVPVPRSIMEQAGRLGSPLVRLGIEFDLEREPDRWHWRGTQSRLTDLPLPCVPGAAHLRNVACALATLEQLQDRLAVPVVAVRHALRELRVPGRFQRIAGRAEWILDVAHNPDAARELASNLESSPPYGRTLAVLGMLDDKDVRGVMAPLVPLVDVWILSSVADARGRGWRDLDRQLPPEIGTVRHAASVPEACALAERLARPGDRILVFGSFRAVGPALDYLESLSSAPEHSYG